MTTHASTLRNTHKGFAGRDFSWLRRAWAYELRQSLNTLHTPSPLTQAEMLLFRILGKPDSLMLPQWAEFPLRSSDPVPRFDAAHPSVFYSPQTPLKPGTLPLAELQARTIPWDLAVLCLQKERR